MATLQQLDMNILLWIQEHLRVDALTPFWRAVTFLGNGGWFWIVLCVLLICFGKTRKTGVTAALSLLSGFLITNLLIKNAVARPRPFDTYTQIIPLITRPKDYSFPSGHTCASFAVALVCLRMLPGKWGILPVVLILLHGYIRIFAVMTSHRLLSIHSEHYTQTTHSNNQKCKYRSSSKNDY